jgi:hypothetical protein
VRQRLQELDARGVAFDLEAGDSDQPAECPPHRFLVIDDGDELGGLGIVARPYAADAREPMGPWA